MITSNCLLQSAFRVWIMLLVTGLTMSMVQMTQAVTYSLPDHEREVVNINPDWRFYKGDVGGAESTGYNDSGWPVIALPHTWNSLDGQDGANDYYRGTGWYRKHLFIDSAYSGKKIFIRFGAANTMADVWVNGHHMGHHRGGYSAFIYDITSRVNFGNDNVIAVKVNNAFTTEVPPDSADFTFFGGIYRDVNMLVTDPVHINPTDLASPGVYIKQTNVSSSSANVEVRTLLRNDTGSSRTVTVRSVITESNGTIVDTLTSNISIGANSGQDVVQSTTISNPRLWNGLSDPYLYKVHVEVAEGPVVKDLVTQPLGLRYFSIDPNTGFSLNGQYLDLRGVNKHQDRQNKGNTVSREDQEEDNDLMLEMGCTMVRFAHYQHRDYTYQLCDETGLVAWAEIPMVNKIHDNTAFYDNAKQQMRELIRQNYNHPSIIFWGLFNEITMYSGPDPTSLVEQLEQVAKQEDDTRLTTGATNPNDTHPTSWVPDTIAYNRYYGWYDDNIGGFQNWCDSFHAAYPNVPIGVSEYGAGSSIYQHQENPPRPSPWGNWHPEEYQNYYHETYWIAMKSRPFLWCKLIWNGFDFAADHRAEGDALGRNDKGMITYDRKVKKDCFYWYKANWSSEPVVYITSRRFTPRPSQTVEVKVYSNCDSVELFVNNQSCGSRSGSDRIFKWTGMGLQDGWNQIKAIGSRGGQTYVDVCYWQYGTSTSKPGYLPNVVITQPSPGETLNAGSVVSVTADASDDGGVNEVRFYANLELVGTDTSSSGGWSINWLPESRGGYELVAEVVDNNQNPWKSEPVYVVIGGSDTIMVNFQPDGSPLPPDYLKDSGLPYGNRGNGYTYGWNSTNENARDRNREADQRIDTLNHFYDFTWELELPAGTYNVYTMMGDPDHTDSRHNLKLEEGHFIDQDREDHLDIYSAPVHVHDGRLTVSKGRDAVNAKINCIVVDPLSVDLPAAPSDLSATLVAGPSIELTWQDNSDDEDGFIIQRRPWMGVDQWGTVDMLLSHGSTGLMQYTDTAGLYGVIEYRYRGGAFR